VLGGKGMAFPLFIFPLFSVSFGDVVAYVA
jgi:hypothetical protein